MKRFWPAISGKQVGQAAAPPVWIGFSRVFPAILVLVLATAVVRGETAAAARNYALIVGISEYPEYGRLAYATNDAIGMAGLARKRGFDYLTLLLNGDATREKIVAAIDDLHARLGPEDVLTFFYSGHALRQSNAAGGYDGYLVPFGCHKGRELEEGLAMADVASMLADLPNRYLTVFIDACHGAMLADAVADGMADVRTGGVSNRIVAVVASSGAGEMAFESDGHGVFTGGLLNALATTEHDSIMGRKPDAELMRDLQQLVETETGGWQQPRMTQYGDWPEPICLRGF